MYNADEADGAGQDEGLWLPKTFLMSVDPPSAARQAAAHAAHTAVADAALGGGGADPEPAPRSYQPPAPPPPPQRQEAGGVGWYQIDGGGSVAFRASPVMEDRTPAVARPHELIYMARDVPCAHFPPFPLWVAP